MTRNNTGTARRRFAVRAIFCIFLSLAAAAGCGKSGPPQPQDPSRSFSWKETSAKAAGNCLAFTGSLDGAYDNLQSIRLEIAGLDGPEDCPGCPFVPSETTEISRRDAGFDRKNGTVAFTYCPRKAKAYRWRLAATSVYSRLPHATMVDRLLVVDP